MNVLYLIIIAVCCISSQSEQNSRQYQHQQSWGPSGGNGGPIQSRSFRVLQKITDTDNSEGKSNAHTQLVQLRLASRGLGTCTDAQLKNLPKEYNL
jgi:hypothetical protein